MGNFPPTIILRHRKENLKKCSLKGLEGRSDMLFFSYPKDALPDLSPYLLLALDGPPLTREDCCFGLFLIDATWRYASAMTARISQPLRKRSIPTQYLTAYPRRQTDCPNPTCGLASIEALFLAYQIIGRKTNGLLDYYYWKDEFLRKNSINIII